jgi:hypothetical protein
MFVYMQTKLPIAVRIIQKPISTSNDKMEGFLTLKQVVHNS